MSRKRSRFEVPGVAVTSENDDINNNNSSSSSSNSALQPPPRPPQQSTPSTPCNANTSTDTVCGIGIRDDNGNDDNNKQKKSNGRGGDDGDGDNNDQDDDFVLGSKLSSLPSLWNDHHANNTTTKKTKFTTPTSSSSSILLRRRPNTTSASKSDASYCHTSESRTFASRNGVGGGRGGVGSSSSCSCSNSTLFGRVMQSASKPTINVVNDNRNSTGTTTTAAGDDNDDEGKDDDHNKKMKEQQSSTHFFQTPTKAKRPTHSSSSSFLSPGGFKLRQAVETASPFAFQNYYNNGGDSNSNSALSRASTTPKPAWRQTSNIHNMPRDWSLKEKLVFDSPSFVSMMECRWMQRTTAGRFVASDNNQHRAKRDTASTRLQQHWHHARTYWQYPHHPNDHRMDSDTTSINSTTRMDDVATSRLPNVTNDWATKTNTMMAANASDSVLQQQQQQQHTATTTEPNSQFATSGGKFIMTPTDRACQQLQMYHPTTGSTSRNTTTEKEWRTAFASLFQGWRRGLIPYFYGRGTDHTILFSHDNNEQSEVLISSCNRHFREWCQSQGITLYVSSGLSPSKNSKEWNENDWKDAPQHTSSLRTKHSHHPPQSPEAAAELAALRRAHVFGQTVGADVSVSFRAKGVVQNIALQRRTWQQVPALLVRGIDDCAAVAEYYVNRRGQIAGSLEWWPVWLSTQPFCHATLQHATVRFVGGPGHHHVHVQGLLLPDKVHALVETMVEYLQQIFDDDDVTEPDRQVTTDVNLQVTCMAAKVNGSIVVRPLDDVVIGQPNLWALMEEDDDKDQVMVSMSPDAVTQITWDPDKPDGFSYKVAPGVVA